MHSTTNKAQPAKNAGYSSDQLQQAVTAYNAHFDDDVPLGLIAAAASAFRSSELMSLLLNRVSNDKKIESWSEFTRRFLSGR